MMRYCLLSLMLVTLLFGSERGAVAQTKAPYWASVSAGQARMRTGPGRQFPASWLYQRPGLPVKIVDTYQNWRKIEDPDGTQGWMQANLLSNDRTGLIVGEVRPLRQEPDLGAKIIWRAEPGVVGKISDCARGWCKIDVRGRMGFVESAHLWGVDTSEARP
jgi:SH3-like domain-containing protein